MNTYIYFLMLSLMKIILAKEDEKKDTGMEKVDDKKDNNGQSEEPNDGSVLVNQAGMQEVVNEDALYKKIPFTSPKGKKPKTIKQISVEAQKNHLSPVAALFAYADPQQIHEIPSTIFSVSDILLKNNTESNEQQVTFGPEFDNSAKDQNEDKDDGKQKNDKDKPEDKSEDKGEGKGEDKDEPEGEGEGGKKPPKKEPKDEGTEEDKEEGGKKPKDKNAGKFNLLE